MASSVNTKEAPKALGPYNQAVRVGQTLYCSGQIGLDPASGHLVDGIEAQAKQVFKNITQVLKAAGLTPKDVVKANIFMTNLADFGLVNDLYADFLGDTETLPARSCVAVAALPAQAQIECEVTAAFPQD
ncbi:Rid family detoxifying hydrolase [Leuconostocaceae bacterium ESL0723]|nr:Rid family detoxifying hydrolase [Leuconostocaceae bacterium ESL0723]